MKRILLPLVLLIAGAQAQELNWNGPARKELKGKGYRVLMKVQNFRARGRSIRYTSVKNREPFFAENISVSGVAVHGFDGFDFKHEEYKSAKKLLESSATEIAQFDVWLGKRHVKVPAKLYDHVLRPNLDDASAKLSKDGKSLTVTLMGADGAAGWITSWKITDNGKVTRSSVEYP